MSTTQTEQQTQEIPETILDQLMQSKIHRFPFFAYTGIKGFVMMGNEALKLKDIPRNPNKITGIDIYYDAGHDAYNVYFEKGVFPKNYRFKGYSEVYFDQLAECITKEMGVY